MHRIPANRRLALIIKVAGVFATATIFFLFLNPSPAIIMREADFDLGSSSSFVTDSPFLEASVSRSRKIPQDDGNKLAHYLNLDKCHISSGDISAETSAVLCSTKEELLRSLSDGGRIGVDAPYHARDCAMWWYTTEELCGVLSRFRGVYFIGDTALADVFGALLVLLREDPLYGAVKQWNFQTLDDLQCSCDKAFMDLKCASARVSNLNEVTDYNRSFVKCKRVFSPDLAMYHFPTNPVSPEELNKVASAITVSSGHDTRPIAVIYGHGQASRFDPMSTAGWTNTIRNAISRAASPESPVFELFVTPGATGYQVNHDDAIRLGVKAAQVFETLIRTWGADNGLDVIGTWNSTVQTTFSKDGLRNGLKPNLLKAMMVLNWLDLVKPETRE